MARMKMKKAIAMLMAVALVGSVPVPASAASGLTVSNKRTVLVAGRPYYVKTKGASNFKSSNSKVASVSKTGKITPKKTGYVVLSATVNGKKVTSKFLCVSKDGKTNSQTKVNKMLKAENVKKITISDTKNAKSYRIANGDYPNKTLTVNAPKSDVTNFGTFKGITIKDVKGSTWFEKGLRNIIKVLDKTFRFISSDDSEIKEFTYAAKGGSANIVIKGKADEMSITGEGSNASISTKGAKSEIKKVTLDAKDTKVTVGGSSEAKTEIVATDKAANAELNVNSKNAQLTLGAKVTINVGEDAKNVDIKLEAGVTVQVNVSSGNTTAKVEVTDSTGSTQTVTPGQNVVVGGGSTDTSDNNSSSGGGSSVTVDPSINATWDEKTGVTTFTLKDANRFEDLKSAKVTIKEGNFENRTFTITSDMAKDANKLLNGEGEYLEQWKSDTSEIGKVYDKVNYTFGQLTKTGNSYTRTLTVDGTEFKGSYDVTVNTDADKSKVESVSIKVNNTTYTITRTGTNNKSFTVSNGATTYTVTRTGDKTITVNGNVEKYVTFSNLKK